MNYGPVFKLIRQRKNIKIEDIVEETSITLGTYNMIETGLMQPSDITVRELCASLNIPVAIVSCAALENSDIPTEKAEVYQELFPIVKQLCVEMFV